MADQAISSLTNFSVTILIARNLTTEEYGAFVVAFTTYLFCLGLSREFASTPILVRYAAAPSKELNRATRSAVGVAMLLGCVSGSLTILVAMGLSAPPQQTLVALGIALPALMAQDTYRMALFAHARPRSAAFNDLVWALSQIAAIATLILLSRIDLSSLTFAWGLSSLPAAFLGYVQTSARPDLRSSTSWLRDNASLSSYLALDFLTSTGIRQVAVYVVGWVGGLSVVGALGAAGMLLGPLNVLFMAGSLLGVPEASRLRHENRRNFLRLIVVVSLILAIAAAIWTLVLYVVPSSLGRMVLGSVWNDARPVLAPTGLLMVAAGLAVGPTIGLRALEEPRALLTVSLQMAPMNLVARALGADKAGALGSAAGAAASTIVSTALIWRKFRRLTSTLRLPS